MKRQFTREERKALDETAILIEKLKASDSLEESTYTDIVAKLRAQWDIYYPAIKDGEEGCISQRTDIYAHTVLLTEGENRLIAKAKEMVNTKYTAFLLKRYLRILEARDYVLEVSIKNIKETRLVSGDYKLERTVKLLEEEQEHLKNSIAEVQKIVKG